MRGRPPKRTLTEEQKRAADAFIGGAEEQPSEKPLEKERAPKAEGENAGEERSQEQGNAQVGGERVPEDSSAEGEERTVVSSRAVPDGKNLERRAPAGDAPPPEEEGAQRVSVLSRQARPLRSASPRQGESYREDPPGPERALYPWEEEWVRADVVKGYALRLQEPLYLKLKYLSERTGTSMNQLVTGAVERLIRERLPEVEEEGQDR